MNQQITELDVLIVYSEAMAQSANSLSEAAVAPFTKELGNESYNLVYSYFLEVCRRNNLRAAFATSNDIVGPGMCSGYWLFKDKSWVKVQKAAFSRLIFDKFSPTRKSIKESRRLLFSSRQIKPFNSPYLFDLCFDKQKTHDKLIKFSIPTVTIKGSNSRVVSKAALELKKRLAKHKQKEDFADEVVMKNRFGAGGRNVYKFGLDEKEKIIETAKRFKNISFILQPFIKFDKGFGPKGSKSPTDIRLIYMGKKVIQTYTRTAKEGDFKCNEHAGGILKYISKKEVPKTVRELSKKIAKLLGNKSSFFALDYIVSNAGNSYLLEANTGPGLDWNLSVRENELEAKKLIRIIVKEIGRRISLLKDTSSKKQMPVKVSRQIISDYLIPSTY